MATITEDYVSFEIAKLLKDKGFDEDCWCWYEEDGYLRKSNDDFGFQSNSLHVVVDDEFSCSAPTLQMAMKWLREVHNIDIDIDAHCGMLGTRCYVTYVSTYKSYELTDTDKKFGLTEDDVKHRLVQSKRNTRIPSKSEIIPAHESFDTYEEAVEKALKYVLENLI